MMIPLDGKKLKEKEFSCCSVCAIYLIWNFIMNSTVEVRAEAQVQR
jgi:hypothetical protein